MQDRILIHFVFQICRYVMTVKLFIIVHFPLLCEIIFETFAASMTNEWTSLQKFREITSHIVSLEGVYFFIMFVMVSKFPKKNISQYWEPVWQFPNETYPNCKLFFKRNEVKGFIGHFRDFMMFKLFLLRIHLVFKFILSCLLLFMPVNIKEWRKVVVKVFHFFITSRKR